MKIPMSEQSDTNFECLVCCAARHASWESGFRGEKRRRRRRRRRGIGGGAAQKNIISHPGEARAEQRAARQQRGNARQRAVRGWVEQAAFRRTLAIHTERLPTSRALSHLLGTKTLYCCLRGSNLWSDYWSGIHLGPENSEAPWRSLG